MSRSYSPEMPEHKVATHDGFIWPVPRHRMVERQHIVERMVEDIAAARRNYGDGPIDLTMYGWTLAQCSRYGHAARGAWRDASNPVHARARLVSRPDPQPVTSDMADVVTATLRGDAA